MRLRPSPNVIALAFALAVHGGVLLLLMLAWWQPPQLRSRTSDLAVFDVRVPPPKPLPVPTRPKLPTRPAIDLPGGTPRAAAPLMAKPVDAAPLAAVLFPQQQSPVRSPIDDEDGNTLLAGASSSGSGGEGGTGSGTGNGVGAGSLRFARAEWIREPDLADVKRYLPNTARGRSIAISVELGCIVPKPGKPKRCWLISESPHGLGFGRAAVAMSSTFRIRPIFLNDEAVNLPVRVPIRFTVSSRP